MNGLRALAGLGLFLGLAGFGWSQAASTSQIQGVVQDASGLPVQGAEVKATQTDTGVARSAVSSADGTYILPNLPIGPYRLEVSKQCIGTTVSADVYGDIQREIWLSHSLGVSDGRLNTGQGGSNALCFVVNWDDDVDVHNVRLYGPRLNSTRAMSIHPFARPTVRR